MICKHRVAIVWKNGVAIDSKIVVTIDWKDEGRNRLGVLLNCKYWVAIDCKLGIAIDRKNDYCGRKRLERRVSQSIAGSYT